MVNSPKNAFGLFVFALAVFTAGSVCVRAQTHLSAEEADKLLIESPTPRYPPIAEKSKIQGAVKLNVAVSKTGSVVSVRTISGHMFLVGPAVEAVKKRRYRPYELNGKPTAFTTIVEVRFSAGIPEDEYERELETARQYFKEADICRSLLKEQKYGEAEISCKATVKIADRLPEHRGLEKSGAYEYVGRAMLGLGRFQEALDYFTRSYEIGKTVLKETDAETGYAYANLGLANHLLGNLDKARDYYDRAENILRQAYKVIEMEDARESYVRVIKSVLQYRLDIAERSGDPKEVGEIKKRMAKVP
jgi:TonB family protein